MIRNELLAAVKLMGAASFITVSIHALRLFTCISLQTMENLITSHLEQRKSIPFFTPWSKQVQGSPHCRETLGLAKMQNEKSQRKL